MKKIFALGLCALCIVGYNRSVQAMEKKNSQLMDIIKSESKGVLNNLLHIACSQRKFDLIKKILEMGANVDGKNEHGNAPLRYACMRGDFELTKVLVDAGAKVNDKNDYGRTVLHEVLSGTPCAEIVKYLVENGASVTIQDQGGVTPLHYACMRYGIHSKDIVAYLILKGADLNSKNKKGQTPLHIAREAGSREIVKYLVEKGANLNIKNEFGNTVLHDACMRRDFQTAKLLLDYNATVNVENDAGLVPLYYACMSNSIEMVDLLLKKNAAVNTKNKGTGWTPLCCACENGCLEIVKRLVENGADINHNDKGGNTPLHCACSNGALEVVKYLLEKGAKIPVDLVKHYQKGAIGNVLRDMTQNVISQDILNSKSAEKIENFLLRMRYEFKCNTSALDRLLSALFKNDAQKCIGSIVCLMKKLSSMQSSGGVPDSSIVRGDLYKNMNDAKKADFLFKQINLEIQHKKNNSENIFGELLSKNVVLLHYLASKGKNIIPIKK